MSGSSKSTLPKRTMQSCPSLNPRWRETMMIRLCIQATLRMTTRSLKLIALKSFSRSQCPKFSRYARMHGVAGHDLQISRRTLAEGLCCLCFVFFGLQLHGGMSPSDRVQALQRFTQGALSCISSARHHECEDGAMIWTCVCLIAFALASRHHERHIQR